MSRDVPDVLRRSCLALARRRTEALRASGPAGACIVYALAAALRRPDAPSPKADALPDGTVPAAHAWAARIEALRQTLEGSEETIAVRDYGAGPRRLGPAPGDGPAFVDRRRQLGELTRSSSRPPFWGRFLMHLVHALRPAACLELGTCLGLSAAYQAAGLALAQGGRLVTLEGAPTLADRARHHLQALGLDHATVVTGAFTETLPAVLNDHGPFAFAFIDGHHDGRATLDYFERLRPALCPGAVVVFDDLAWSPSMRRAWHTLRTHPAVATSVDFLTTGVCILGPGTPQTYRLPMP